MGIKLTLFLNHNLPLPTQYHFNIRIAFIVVAITVLYYSNSHQKNADIIYKQISYSALVGGGRNFPDYSGKLLLTTRC